MDQVVPYDERDSSFWAPGTIVLEDNVRSRTVILHPQPTTDPNDPLNWATWRKMVNFTLVCFYVLMTFVQLDIGFTAWQQYEDELGFTVDMLNNAAAANYAALALGCVIFVPLINKYGRRPLYLFSTSLQLASCVWFAKTESAGDLYGSNVISGLGGAISETIVQITIADLFFVHNHAAMNAWYLFATMSGAYLGPVASGYVVDSQGWRWMFWWCVIFFAVNLVLIIFFFDESKYVSVLVAQHHTQLAESNHPVQNQEGHAPYKATNNMDPEQGKDPNKIQAMGSVVATDHTIKLKSYRERLALITKTDGSILHDLYQPIILLFRFPAVAYTALIYGSILAWFAVLTSVQATYLFDDPYDFSAAGVGLMNIAPFIGTIPGSFIGGWLNDKSILRLAKRNNGIYEPEMRLWLALPAAIIVPAGILMFGIGLSQGVAWPLLAVGYGVFGFGFTIAGDVALSYTMDCYQDTIGTALVGVVFVRNACSMVVLYALTPWIIGMGLQNLHILIAVLAFAFLLTPVLLLIWGKKARIASAKAYREMASRQPTHRDVLANVS